MIPARSHDETLAKITSMPDKETFTFILTHSQLSQRPNIGDYVVVVADRLENDEEEEKWLAVVVEAQEIVLDENEVEVRNLLAVDDIAERERSRYLATEYKCKLVGTFTFGVICPHVRHLPYRTLRIRYPTIEELHEIVSIDREGFKLGELIVGGNKIIYHGVNNRTKTIPFKFNLERLRNKRTAVFGQTGYGKSNLTKALIAGYAIRNPQKGICIFDRSGEYVNASEWSQSLCEIEPLKNSNRIVVIDVCSEKLDLFEIDSEKIVEFLVPEKDALRAGTEYFIFLSHEQKKKILEAIIDFEQHKDEPNKAGNCLKIIEEALKKVGAGNPSVMVPSLFRTLRKVVKQFHTPNSRVPKQLMNFLKEGKIVVFNLANVSDDVINRLTRFIVNEVIENNSADYVMQREPTECLFLIEEAQNFLNPDNIKESNDPVVRLAKEGRKYKLGLVYVTQQPGAIDDSILSQTNNFFVFHLLTNQDVKKICSVAPQYELFATSIQEEPARGIAYVYSNVYEGIQKPFPIVITTEVESFNNVVASINANLTIYLPPRDYGKEIENAFVETVKEVVEQQTFNIPWTVFWRRVNEKLPNDNPYKNGYGKGKSYPDPRIIPLLEEKFSIIKVGNQNFRIIPEKTTPWKVEKYNFLPIEGEEE